jgi:ribose transport system permease protein
MGIPMLILALAVLTQMSNPAFLTIDNLMNVARQVSILASVACGMTFVIMSGGVDLSVGSTIGLVSVFVGTALKQVNSVALGLALGMAIGAACGAVNGFLVHLTGIHPFIVTLATMTVFKGVSFTYTQGLQIAGLPDDFLILGTGYWGPVPILPYFAAGAAVVSTFILRKTKLGIYTRAIGGREEAALVTGIDIRQYKVFIFMLCGAFAGLAGVLLTSRVIAAQASLGAGYHLQAIGASVIGGARLGGGYGSIGGTMLGVLVMGILSNSLNLLRVSSFWQEVAVGAAIIIAVAADTARQHRLKGR